MMKKHVVIGLGEFLWDMLPEGKKAGGAPVNFVYHASRLGADGYAISAVGDDELGREIISELEFNHINYIIEKVGYPTGTVLVKLDSGIPQYDIVENVAWDHIPVTPRALEVASRADAVCFGSLAQRSPVSRAAVQAIVRAVPETAYRCFDINIRQHYYSEEVIRQSLEICNLLKINDEELVIVKDIFGIEGTDDQICKWLIDKYNLRYVILTAGAAFSSIYTSSEVSTIQTPKVKVIDTVGAGDSFLGAFIAALFEGRSLEAAHSSAVERAALVCTCEGAWCI